MNRTKETTSTALLPDCLPNSVYCEESRQYEWFQYIDKGLAQALRYSQGTVTAAVQRARSMAAHSFGLFRLTTTNYNFRTVMPAYAFRLVAGFTSAGGACPSGTTTVTPVALLGKCPSKVKLV